MRKMTRPVMKHLTEMNFKNWDRLDEVEKLMKKVLVNLYGHYPLYKELTSLLTQIKDDVVFIDDTFRDYLEEN